MSTIPRELQTATVNGVTLAYAEQGEGQAVVLVHGTSQDMRTWRHQLAAVATHHRVIAYSRRYARPNPDIPPGQEDPMDPHVDDLIAFLRERDAAPAHLVGSSWGAFISLLLAIREPALVRTLVLCEPPVLPLFISNHPRPVELARLFARRPLDAFRIARFGVGVVEPAAKAYRAGDVERGGRIFGNALLGRRAYETLPEDTKRMVDENQAVEIAQLLGTGFPPLRAADVQAVRAPALLVAGEHSPAVLRVTLLGELDRLLPAAERVIIPDASHLMHEQNPRAFNQALLTFLARQN